LTDITLLYTTALAGRLALLPQLLTRIRQERATRGPDGITLLVDLGRSCVTGGWLCDVTEGRGMLVAMDAMGYDAFHLGPQDMLYTRPAQTQQLRSVIQTQLAAGPWIAKVSRRDMTFAFASRFDAPVDADLITILRLSDTPQVEIVSHEPRRVLLLDAGWLDPEPLLGRVDIAITPEPPYIQVTNQARLTLPPHTLPDPTMTSVIEFVESEARYAEQQMRRQDARNRGNP